MYIIVSYLTGGLLMRSTVSGVEFYGPALGAAEVVEFESKADAETKAEAFNGRVGEAD